MNVTSRVVVKMCQGVHKLRFEGLNHLSGCESKFAISRNVEIVNNDERISRVNGEHEHFSEFHLTIISVTLVFGKN